MCGCFVLALGAFAPRLALALMALFNDEITKAFDGSWLVPFIGWIFLPYSTLTFVRCHPTGEAVDRYHVCIRPGCGTDETTRGWMWAGS